MSVDNVGRYRCKRCARAAAGGSSSSEDGPAEVEMPQCIRLVRTGDEFTAFRYTGGEWARHGNSVTIPMAQDVYIGLAVTSHEANFSCSATFDRVCSDEAVAMDLVEDDVVNFEDYADLLNHWLERVWWPE